MKKVIALLSIIVTFIVLPCCILYKLGAIFTSNIPIPIGINKYGSNPFAIAR